MLHVVEIIANPTTVVEAMLLLLLRLLLHLTIAIILTSTRTRKPHAIGREVVVLVVIKA